MIEIREKDFESFFAVPEAAYGRGAPYVSPLKGDLRRALSTANPLFASDAEFAYFTALRQGRPLGRIVAHAHPASNAKFGWSRAYFGFFDCADDADAAASLLARAEAWGRAQGFSEILGNFNLTAMQQMGVQTGGFEAAGYTDMILSPPQIAHHLEASGYVKRFPMTTFEIPLKDAPRLPTKPGLALDFAPITKRSFAARMAEARALLNDGFAQNPFFVPLTEEEFTFQAGEMSAIMDPRLSSVAMLEGRPAGVVVSIPDLNGFLRWTRSRLSWRTPFAYLAHRLTRRRAVIIYYSVGQAAQGRGVMQALLDRTCQTALAAGYETLGVTWIGEGNKASLAMMEKLGARPLHDLHLFAKGLT